MYTGRYTLNLMAARLEPGHHIEFKRTAGRHAGKWVARFWYESLKDGDLRKKESLHATLGEARQVNRQRSAELVTRGRVPLGRTSAVESYVQDWLERNRSNWAQSTLVRRRSALRTHIQQDAFSKTEIGKVRHLDLDDFLNRLSARGVNAATRKSVRDTLNVAFQDAVKREVIHENPVRLSRPPARSKRKCRFFDEGQTRSLLEAAKGDHLEPLAVTMVFAGLRLSEAVGLTWERVDFEKGTLRVDRQLQRQLSDDAQGSTFRLSAVKTVGSMATVPVAGRALEQLRLLRGKRLLEGHSLPGQLSGLVFLTPQGTPWHRKSLLVAFNRLYRSVGLPPLGVHALRHTCASILINNGASPLEVQRHLRHASVRTTLEDYSHLFPEKLQGNLDILERVLATDRI